MTRAHRPSGGPLAGLLAAGALTVSLLAAGCERPAAPIERLGRMAATKVTDARRGFPRPGAPGRRPWHVRPDAERTPPAPGPAAPSRTPGATAPAPTP
ncbi:hypothetical protein AB0M57_15445 [Streptomyces sp. NPDC051597]|uniref:hypothetical protein n=1 Tax=Streptomyces sp. NPDC051597 TaxID=3155049 RepID=UPI00343BEB12